MGIMLELIVRLGRGTSPGTGAGGTGNFAGTDPRSLLVGWLLHNIGQGELILLVLQPASTLCWIQGRLAVFQHT